MGPRRIARVRRRQPAHLQFVRTGKKAPNYEGLTSLDARFRMMDEFDGYRQIVSLAGPPPEHIAPNAAVELATIANDELAELVAKYPKRFAGAVAAVPMNDPDRACREIERATGKLGLCAVQIYTNVNGRALDAPEFRPVFQTLAERRCARYSSIRRAVGPTPTTAPKRESKYLIWQVFGWPYETSAATMRLVFSGIMQDYPNLENPGAPHGRDDSVLSWTHAVDVRDVRRATCGSRRKAA